MRRITPPRSINTPAPPNGMSGLTPVRAKPLAADFGTITSTTPVSADEGSATVRDGTAPSAGVTGCPDTFVVPAIRPRLTSACVTTYWPAAHVSVSPGTKVGLAAEQARPAGATRSATTRISDIVTFPVLVTTKEYDTRSPARDTLVRVALFTTDNPGARAAVTVPEDDLSDTVRSGATPPTVGAWPEATV